MDYPRGGYPSCQRMSYAMNVYCPEGYWEYAYGCLYAIYGSGLNQECCRYSSYGLQERTSSYQ